MDTVHCNSWTCYRCVKDGAMALMCYNTYLMKKQRLPCKTTPGLIVCAWTMHAIYDTYETSLADNGSYYTTGITLIPQQSLWHAHTKEVRSGMILASLLLLTPKDTLGDETDPSMLDDRLFQEYGLLHISRLSSFFLVITSLKTLLFWVSVLLLQFHSVGRLVEVLVTRPIRQKLLSPLWCSDSRLVDSLILHRTISPPLTNLHTASSTIVTIFSIVDLIQPPQASPQYCHRKSFRLTLPHCSLRSFQRQADDRANVIEAVCRLSTTLTSAKFTPGPMALDTTSLVGVSNYKVHSSCSSIRNGLQQV